MVADKKESLEWLTDQPEGFYEVKPWHPKRTLTANNYYWAMVNELAKAVRDVLKSKQGQAVAQRLS